jgi:hypothetical protein
MNLKNFILVAVLIISVLIIGCQPKSPPTGANTNELLNSQAFVAIQNPERVTHNTFSMVKPKEWKEVQYASSVLVYLPPESDIKDQFAEKYSMAVGFLPENNTDSLKELTDKDMIKMKELMPALEIGNYEDARVGQLDGLRIKFLIRVQNRTIESTQLRTMQGRVLYAFSQQCLEGECKYTDTFYEMAESFEWKNPQ